MSGGISRTSRKRLRWRLFERAAKIHRGLGHGFSQPSGGGETPSHIRLLVAGFSLRDLPAALENATSSWLP
jgi:hypothetical protein